MKIILRFQKYLLLVIICYFITPNIYAQENYLPGIIIKKDDVAVKGFIDYGNWAVNPNEISFKQGLSKPAVIYSPMDIAAFKVEDEVYVSAIVEAKISTNRIDRIKVNQDLETEVDTTFLQTIIEGEKSLYFYKNKLDVGNFYIKNAGEFELLQYWKYLKKDVLDVGSPSEKKYTAEQKKYIGQLTLYLNDCAKIKSKLNNTTYTLKSLKSLFESYYSCADATSTFSKNTDKYLLNFGVLAGATYNKLKFETIPEFADGFDYDDFDTSVNFSAGLYLDYNLPRNFNKWSISNDLVFTSFNINRTSEKFVNENNYTKSTGTLNFSYFKLFSTIKYSHPINNSFDVYVNAGISNGFAIVAMETYASETKFYTTERNESGTSTAGFRKYEQGLTASLGAVYNKYRVELKYERGNGIFNYQYINSTSNRFYLLLGYSLFSKN